MKYAKRILEIILFILFCSFCNLLLVKYFSRKVSVAVEKIKVENKAYSSISVCPLNGLRDNMDHFIEEKSNLSAVEILNEMKKVAWKRNETFYFVNYATKDKPGFECLTLKYSNDPMKPCVFPFMWDGELFHNCSKASSNSESWCITKANNDNTINMDTLKRWGICDLERCHGQKFVPENIHNRVNDETYWRDEVYDLRTWYDGWCHTFKPLEIMPKGKGYVLAFYLGHDHLMNHLSKVEFKQFSLVIWSSLWFKTSHIFLSFFIHMSHSGLATDFCAKPRYQFL